MRTRFEACILSPALAAALAACSSAPTSSFGGAGNEVVAHGPTGGAVDAGQVLSLTGIGTADAQAASLDGPIDTTAACDLGLPVDGDAAGFAQAMGICTTAAGAGYGLVSATYSRAFGSADAPHAGQWGILPTFGSVIVPREGTMLGVLSSGYAREFDDAEGTQLNYSGKEEWQGPGDVSDFVNSSPDGPLEGMDYPTGAAPPGFPKAAGGCKQDNKVNDMIDLKLTLKAPSNASGFRFDFDFYSSQWPNYVCSNYNDAFIAYLTSTGLTDNISFDSNNDPIAVNTNFFNRCTPDTPVGCNSVNPGVNGLPLGTSACAGGPSELAGTGFGAMYETWCSKENKPATLGGATGWLTTQAPITPGEEFTLEFMIWDAGDGLLDSSVLLDNFQWIGGAPVTTSTVRPPPPK